MPNNIEDYIHRIGRTGRVGNKGTAVSFFNKNNSPVAKDLVNILTKMHQEVPPFLYEYINERVTSGKKKPYYNKYGYNNNFVRYNNMNRTSYNASPYNNMGYSMMGFRGRGTRGGFQNGGNRFYNGALYMWRGGQWCVTLTDM